MKKHIYIADTEATRSTMSQPRNAVRGILFDQNRGMILVQYLPSWDITTFPGGGVNDNETIEDAMIREFLEETGYEVEIIDHLVTVEEWRSGDGFHQLNHCYLLADLSKQKDQLTQAELSYGLKNNWLEMEKCFLMFVENDNLLTNLDFIKKRDAIFVQAFRQYINV